MFRFDNPIYLWLLLLIPLSASIYLYSVRKRNQRIRKFGNPELLHQLSPMISRRRMWVKSKLLVENLMNKFSEDKIGLIVFAGDAFVQLPITGDYVSAKMFLDNINPSLIGTQGTDIGKALQLSINSFTPNSKVGKAIILITDGEDNEGGAEAMAKQARNKGIKVFILGIGSKEGSTIPMPDGTELKDSNGEPVKTHLNEDMCRRIAAAGQGVYVHVDNSNVADAVLGKELGKLQKGEINNVLYSDFDEQFQALALLVVILLIADVLILERKKRR